jgi:hypothetical protein
MPCLDLVVRVANTFATPRLLMTADRGGGEQG